MPRGVRSKCTRACPVGAIRSIVHGINKPPKALLQALRLSFHFGLRISRPRPGNVTAAIALVRRDWGRTKENSSNGRRVDLRRPSAVVGPKRQERHQLLTYDRDVRKQCCRLALVIAGRRRKKLQKHLRSFDSWPNRRFQFLETPASHSSLFPRPTIQKAEKMLDTRLHIRRHSTHTHKGPTTECGGKKASNITTAGRNRCLCTTRLCRKEADVSARQRMARGGLLIIALFQAGVRNRELLVERINETCGKIH